LRKLRFIFTSLCDEWNKENFQNLIYNDKYINFDPDYNHKRPLANLPFYKILYQKIYQYLIMAVAVES